MKIQDLCYFRIESIGFFVWQYNLSNAEYSNHKVGERMETSTITIHVTSEAANFYKSASVQERRKLNALLSLRLREIATPSRSLKETIREASIEAKRNGLTEEILQDILNEK